MFGRKRIGQQDIVFVQPPFHVIGVTYVIKVGFF
jgi:hypothetical protein